MIFGAKIEYEGPDGNTLVLDSDDGTRTLPISDEALGELDRALNPYRDSMILKEVVRRERATAGNISLREYHCADPESDFFELARTRLSASVAMFATMGFDAASTCAFWRGVAVAAKAASPARYFSRIALLALCRAICLGLPSP